MKYLSVKWLEACWCLLIIRAVDLVFHGPSRHFVAAAVTAVVMFVVSLAGFGVAYLVKRSR